jgi:calcineurin-like phosphoesterase family protein
MKHWIITDTHFNHTPQMYDYCNRPENYQEQIWESLESIKSPYDVLIHLGDITIGGDKAVHERINNLPCKKWLVKGNHDNKSDSWYLEHGWDFVCDAVLLQIVGVRVLLSHVPHPNTGYGINIHGHFHNSDHRRHEPELRAIANPRQHLFALEYDGYKVQDLQKMVAGIVQSSPRIQSWSKFNEKNQKPQ